MQTESVDFVYFLGDGTYRGFWSGNRVTIPFVSLKDVEFEVLSVLGTYDTVEVTVEVYEGRALVETI